MISNRIKRILIAGVLCGTLCLGTILPAFEVNATGTAGEKELTPEEKQKKEYEELIKKTFEMPVQTNEAKGWPQATGTHGNAAIVMDADSGAVLYGKNIEKQEYPASITKMLTALLVFEYDAMDLTVEITPECQECLGAGYANIGSDVGDVLTMEEAMHAMLLASANDIAYAIGDAVGKSMGHDYEWFLKRMNERVLELGGVHSNFLNTNGVFDEKHYTCAYDMALISRELCEYPEFFEICQTQQYKIEASDTTEEHVFQQKHDMLILNDSDYYPYATAGKTGFTTEAQNTLVTIANDGEKELVCVLLYTYPGYVFPDTKALFDYGFKEFESVKLQGQLKANVTGFPADATVMLPNDAQLEDVVMEITENKATRGTTISYYYEGNQVGLYQLKTRYEVEEVVVNDVAGSLKEDGMSEGMKKLILLIGGLLLLLLIYVKIKINQKRKRRKQRREKLRRQREMEQGRKKRKG